MKRYLYLTAFLIGTGITLFFFVPSAFQPEAASPSEKISKQQRIEEVLEDERRRTQDPALGRVPTEEMLLALEQTRRLQRQFADRYERDALPSARFREHGPNNIGGRTRVILIDGNDPTRRKVFAGGVSGGLWYTENAAASQPVWQKVNDYLDNISIGALAQDPNDPQVLYLGTGEAYAGIPGLALFKSTDGGSDWELLPTTLNASFQFTQALFVHPVTGHVYAGTSQGLWRSLDEGATWTKVLGTGLGVSNEVIHDLEYSELTNTMYVSTATSVLKSSTGSPGDWISLTAGNSGFMTGVSRVEIAVAATLPARLYAIGNRSGSGTEVYQMVDTPGSDWSQRTAPVDLNGVNYTRGQGGYDLEIAVDPRNPNRIFLGGIDLYLSTTGGVSWQQISLWTGGARQFVHADQHKILFDQEDPNIMFFGNDGGVFRSDNGSTDIYPINTEYNVTQFYAGAIHPEAGRNYLIGGTQDNGSLQLDGPGIVGGREVLGGDGFFCHIDENEPEIQLVSLYYADYALSTNGGQSFGGGASFEGRFVSPSDYDSETNTLYSQTNTGDFYRWNVNTNQSTLVDVAGADLGVSTLKCDPNVSNRLYIGTFSGEIYRIDNAHTGSLVNATLLSPLVGTVGSVDIEAGDPLHLLVTLSNYGVNSVYESFDGGESWINLEGNLPNMPVRWGIFNPTDNRSAVIATELGVWVTEQFNGDETQWLPPASGRGTPLVRTTMLELRTSDRVVMASTYGRGLFTTDVFAEPAPRFSAPAVGYLERPVAFRGDLSTNAADYFWEFGDGATDTLENPRHAFANPGVYPVRLTINGNLSVASEIKILPDRPLPYQPDTEAYGGNFENNTEQYGVETISGSSFERGLSTINGKGGVHSGENAFVLGLEESYYQPFTHSMLYLPNFDFSEQTIYGFSFWAKHQIHLGFDGFRVEYSTDRGETWNVLGSEAAGWYNFTNTNAEQAAWPVGTSYFTGTEFNWVNYEANVSFLAGQSDVAFRFVFKGDGFGNYIGLAIDDVAITRYEGEPVTRLLNFEGEYSTPEEVTLRWTTEPEFKCRRFELQQSLNGRDFETFETVAASGVTTSQLQNYNNSFLGQRSLYFFRIKVMNEDPAIDYDYVFFSPTIVLRRNAEGTDVYRLFPNPFTDRIELTFNNIVDRPVPYGLFDVSGRLLQEGKLEAVGAYGRIEVRDDLPFGTYFLRLELEGQEPRMFKLQGGRP